MMAHRYATLILLSIVSECFGSKPVFVDERRDIDGLVSLTENEADGAFALAALEAVAEGKVLEVVPLMTSVNLPERKWLADPWVRSYALKAIGSTGLREAFQYLSALTTAALRPDSTGFLTSGLSIAYQTAKLRQIEGASAQTEYLESVLKDKTRSVSMGYARTWAIGELCDRGSLASLPLIESTLQATYSPEQEEPAQAFCEARIRVITSKSDRVSALASVLKVGPSPDRQLMFWAIEQLIGMRTPAATAQLKRFLADTSGSLNIDDQSRDTMLSARENARSRLEAEAQRPVVAKG